MTTTIEVENEKDGDLIRRGLAEPDVRAFVKVMGALVELPSDQSMARVLRYVSDLVAEEQAVRERSTT